MKKLLVLVAALLVVPTLFAQGSVPASAYLVAEYSNNTNPNVADPLIHLINVGTTGTPLTEPAAGNVCANIYVFDAQQEMISCCSCLITPNGRVSARVGRDLTLNSVTGLMPASGVIKIVATNSILGFTCINSAARPFDGNYAPGALVGYFTELEATTQGSFLVGHEMQQANLNTTLPTPSQSEAAFLPQACQFIQYIGSGFGICNSCRAQ